MSIGLWRQAKHAEGAQRSQWAAVSALCFAVVLSYLGNLYLFAPENGIRYSIPLLLPAVTLAIFALYSATLGKDDARRAARVGTLISIGVALFLVFGFGRAIQERFDRVVRQRTLLSFPVAATKGYRQYVLTSVGVQAANYIERVQRQFEPGTAVMAWIRTPFQLDQRRNRIYHVNERSIDVPWTDDFPLEGSPEEVRTYLRQLGVRYVFLEHGAPGMKTDDEFMGQVDSPYPFLRRYVIRNLALRRVLKALAEHSEALYKTPDTVVFDIEKVVEHGVKETREK